jgi:hypothetical protein
MTKKLKRRSLKAADGAAPAAPTTVDTTTGKIDPEIPLETLTGISGIGAVVAKRVLEIAPTVSSLWGRWADAGTFASEVKGLSAAGASKIWDKVRDAWPSLAPQTTAQKVTKAAAAAPEPAPTPPAAKPKLKPAAPLVPEVVPASVKSLNHLPAPYNNFTDEQLKVLLPTLTGYLLTQVSDYLEPPPPPDPGLRGRPRRGPMTEPHLPPQLAGLNPDQLTAIAPTLDQETRELVERYVAWATEEVAGESAPEPEPTLPAGYEEFTIDQLNALLPTLTGDVEAQVRAYLWHSPAPSAPAVVVSGLVADNNLVQQTDSSVVEVVKKPVMGNMLDFFKKEAARYSNGGGGGKTPFVKLTSGRNVLRLLGPYKTGSAPFRLFKNHTYTAGGRTQFALCFNWIRSDETIARYLLDEGKISTGDILAARELGDPMQELPIRLSQQDRKTEAKNMWARTRYLWNVIDRSTGEHKVWESSKTFFDQVALWDESGNLVGGLLSVYPDLFDPIVGRDLQINGNGKDGTDRRYLPPLALEPSPSGLPDTAKMFDLDAVVARKAKKWNEKAEALFALSGRLANSVGMTPNEWLGAADRDSDDDIPF